MDKPTIRQLRDNNGWTQEQLAERVGAHWNTIARWERGEVMPPASARRLLAIVFEVPPDGIAYPRSERDPSAP